MATQTTYYEFNKPAGTDLVNPLTDTNPNWDIADNALHEINTRSFANATETVVLGVHAISRLNTYTKFIKWVATANFTAGDTFTVDGNVVAASTPAGATLETNAYVTGSVVIACLNADDSAMTVYVGGSTTADNALRLGGELPAYYAKQSDMTSAQTDIGNIKALNGTTSIASIGDGTTTGAISAINADLIDIKGGLRGMLDFTNAVILSGNINYTTTNAGTLIGLARSTSSSSGDILIDGKPVAYVAGSGTGSGNINPIYIDGIDAGSVITSSVSIASGTSSPVLYFVPYKTA